jgi:sterol desaturase/sphingolipid hydroxylase (fatty acid hydroxylase superfamily)
MARSNRSFLSRIVPPLLLGGSFIALTVLEHRRPLRPEREPKLLRLARNVAIAVLSAAVVSRLDRPFVIPAAQFVERRRWGLLLHIPMSPSLRAVIGIVLLDYTMYLWHILLHRVPWLWRFHVVHHADLDLDASTALRFHFGELALSVPWRLAQIALLGITPGTLLASQRLLFLSVLFHHSKIRLPIAIERLVNRVVVTPRMHGIHHSMVPEETNSNWSSGLTVWDLLHGTARLNVPQDAITIGVPAYREPADVTFTRMVALPFEHQRPWRQLPATAEEPQPHVTDASPTYLVP